VRTTYRTQITQIKNICAAIAQLPSQYDACVGYLLDDTQQRHGIYWKSTDHTQRSWKTYTLDQVLAGTHDHLTPLSLHDKFQLAVDLASGVLELHQTPWLNEDWKQSDVLFIHRPGAPKSAIYEHPFVYCEVSQTAIQQALTTSTTVDRVIRNKTLYTLGIVLIELCYGRQIQALQEHEDLDCTGTRGPRLHRNSWRWMVHGGPSHKIERPGKPCWQALC
jgi:hypothetical protein